MDQTLKEELKKELEILDGKIDITLALMKEYENAYKIVRECAFEILVPDLSKLQLQKEECMEKIGKLESGD